MIDLQWLSKSSASKIRRMRVDVKEINSRNWVKNVQIKNHLHIDIMKVVIIQREPNGTDAEPFS